jgi:CheY-like chemotaxis protein
MREVVQETIEFVKPTLNDRIKLTAELPARPVPVEGDFGQLQQVLLNIVWNARDVLPEGGDIRIKLAAKGTQVRLSVSDSGPGIPPEVKARIFEPFFTTKERGSGTGLGLSISFGIVRGHHGQIAVDSAPGKGTTFALTFPLHADQAETGTDAAERDLILVVDDDDLVRRATSATLTRMGYNVVEVRNGPLAVELVTVRPARFAAVLLDLVMPGMAGRDVFRAVRKLRPDIPVIVCTGYAAAGHIDDQMKRSISGLLQKPFSPERLEAALHSVGVEPERRPARAVAGAR